MNSREKKINLLKSIIESTSNINLYVNAIANKLYEGDEKIAFEGLAFISEELTWIFKGLELTNDIVNMESLNNTIIEHFNVIVESLENEDYILIADILNYEISPLLNDLINLIKESIK